MRLVYSYIKISWCPSTADVKHTYRQVPIYGHVVQYSSEHNRRDLPGVQAWYRRAKVGQTLPVTTCLWILCPTVYSHEEVKGNRFRTGHFN